MALPNFKKELISDLQNFCQSEYHFKCECMVCSTDFWMPSTFEVRFANDELYKIVLDAFWMPVESLRELPNERFEFYERNAFKFLEKYDRFHPIEETCSVWSILILMWHMRSTRFWKNRQKRIYISISDKVYQSLKYVADIHYLLSACITSYFLGQIYWFSVKLGM